MLYRFLAFYFELLAILNSFWAKLSTKKITKNIEYLSKNESFQNYLILCIYDISPRPDLKSLIRHFSDAGYGVIAVVSNDAHKQYLELIDIIVHIEPVGRDFLAYQQGYEVMKKISPKDNVGRLCFMNDSVWYFMKYQPALIKLLAEKDLENELIVGTQIFDQIPHVSGWFFSPPLNSTSILELDKLYKSNFMSKSRHYNIRKGEHQILPIISSVNAIINLDVSEHVSPFPFTYKAVSEGIECFYMKADCTLRTNPVKSDLDGFLKTNSVGNEYYTALRWLASKSDQIYSSNIRRIEARKYMEQFFSN